MPPVAQPTRPSAPEHMPLARVHFSDDAVADLQGLAASLLELARINNAVRLLDPTGASYGPHILSTNAFYRIQPQFFVGPEERLYVTESRKSSPTWVEIATLGVTALGTAGVLWQAYVQTLSLLDQRKQRREELRWRIYEVLRRELKAEDSSADKAADLVHRSMIALKEGEVPVHKVILRDAPRQQGTPDPERLTQELLGSDDIYEDR